MTDTLSLRVMVHESWDEVDFDLPSTTSVIELKRLALVETRAGRPEDAYEVKFRGALVRDESATLADLGVVANAQLIVLSRRRQPVR